jgi:hypothetical protein
MIEQDLAGKMINLRHAALRTLAAGPTGFPPWLTVRRPHYRVHCHSSTLYHLRATFRTRSRALGSCLGWRPGAIASAGSRLIAAPSPAAAAAAGRWLAKNPVSAAS